MPAPAPRPHPEYPDPRRWLATVAAITLSTLGCCATVVWLLISRAAVTSVLLTLGVLGPLGLLWLSAVLTPHHHPRHRWLLALPPAVLLLTGAVACSDIPDDLSWRYSRASLAQLTTQCEHTTPTRQGMYLVTAMSRTEQGCLLYIDSGPGFPHGFAYYPSSQPISTGARSFTHIHGPWYRFTDIF